jgi:hypothetical protein
MMHSTSLVTAIKSNFTLGHEIRAFYDRKLHGVGLGFPEASSGAVVLVEQSVHLHTAPASTGRATPVM